jgi:TolB-like protein/tRNA A-37 threonylcarbamoyl transferase component Bud32
VADPLELLRAALEGRYAVERLIGQGGMATVYLARDDRHDRPVAVKVLRAELAASIGADRFLREIKVAARLQHPNILALYDSGEAAGFLYYVMPFVKGESLRVRLDREEQLSLPDAIGLTCEIAEALYCAHTQQVIHRDIKPENILLHEGHALVADFGIARAVTHAEGDKLTETGMAVGTPHYMSPEQAHGGDRVDGRADQYSLACMLYEMLVGQPPFHGPNAMAILARHSMEVVPSLQVVRNSIPDEVEDAIMRALEKTPADRFPTIREFAEALAEAPIGPLDRRNSSRAIRARRTAPRGVKAVERETPIQIVTAAIRKGGVKFWSAAVASLMVLAALGWGGWRALHKEGPDTAAAGGADPKRLAVMYFASRGGSDSLGHVADGLTEALIHELSEVSALRVISQNGVLPYKNSAVPPDSVARALKVGTLVEGTLTQAGDRLRVSVSLVNAVTGDEIGSKTLERPREEVFALQDDLAKEVAIFLRERLGQEIRVRESQTGTRNVAAWELLQRAEQLVKDVDPLLATADTAAASRRLASADTLLARAGEMDPKWATPLVKRGWLAYRQFDLIGTFDKAYYLKWIQRGMAHAERALQLKPDAPDALELRGTLRYYKWILNLEPDQTAAAQLLAGAEKDLRGAVAGDPTAAFAWSLLSHLLMGQSETGEAKLAAMKAYEADPYLTAAKQTVWRLFNASLDLEDGVEAHHWCDEGRRRFPEYNRFVECQIWLYALKGETPDIPKAWQLLEQYVQITPPPQREFQRRYGQMIVAMALARAGLKDSADVVAKRARADAATDPTRDLALLETYVRILLEDQAQAIRLLSTYIATNPQFRASLARDQSWWFQSLRDDPRFKALSGTGS